MREKKYESKIKNNIILKAIKTEYFRVRTLKRKFFFVTLPQVEETAVLKEDIRHIAMSHTRWLTEIKCNLGVQ